MAIPLIKRIVIGSLLMSAIFTFICFLPATEIVASTAAQQTGSDSSKLDNAGKPSPAQQKTPPPGPLDSYDRGTPRTAVTGFIETADDGKFQEAARYLDLRALPSTSGQGQGPKLARQLKTILDRSLVIDPDLLSDDPEGRTEKGLDPSLELLGHIKTPVKTVDISLERLPRKDGALIWKFSRQTVAAIPHLNKHFGYRPFEAYLSQYFPNVVFLGWQLWQWAALLIGIGLAYLVAVFLSLVIRWVVQRRSPEMASHMDGMGMGPVRILAWFFLVDMVITYIGPSVSIREVLSHDTLGIIAFTWAALRLVDLGHTWLVNRLSGTDQETNIPLLMPARTFIKIVVFIMAVLVWLDNLGFNVGTLLAGLGVGGLAFALAAQDVLKNFLGSIMILLDKPYHVGQRVVVKGHDGIVEEIGLRSTKLRLLSGHQTTISNEQMANTDIENISRRPHIRRLFNIAIRIDTPLAKVEKAVTIVESILENHEGMDPDFQPRVYFNDLNRDSLNLIILYWYHPPDYWAFMALNQRINKQIMAEFEKEGIKFALPSTSIDLTQRDEHSPQGK